jgi:hypothetical protein
MLLQIRLVIKTKSMKLRLGLGNADSGKSRATYLAVLRSHEQACSFQGSDFLQTSSLSERNFPQQKLNLQQERNDAVADRLQSTVV